MNAQDLFEIWAPSGGVWSPWAKPVLFAPAVGHEAAEERPETERRSPATWAPPPERDAALVLDLAGVEAVALGLECAEQGYRPVPLFNSCSGPAAIVDNHSIRNALALGASRLSKAGPPLDAPPAFLLDAGRMRGFPRPGCFDNRWMVFPQDLPSANFLLARGLRRAVLVQRGEGEPRDDLAHVLLRWQRAGIAVLAVDLAQSGEARAIAVRKPSRFGWFFYRTLAMMRLHPNSAGGFGAVVPQPSQGRGFG